MSYLSKQTISTSAAVPAWSDFLHIARSVGHIAAIGSLIWKPIPGTRPVAPIHIEGYRKAFNTRVTTCRGDRANPGLVLGLETDRRSVAAGVLLRVSDEKADDVWVAFLARELAEVGYVPAIIAVRRLDTGAAVPAAGVLVDTSDQSYWHGRADETSVIIRSAAGACGTNLDYALRSLAADREIHGHLPPELADLEQRLGGPATR